MEASVHANNNTEEIDIESCVTTFKSRRMPKFEISNCIRFLLSRDAQSVNQQAGR